MDQSILKEEQNRAQFAEDVKHNKCKDFAFIVLARPTCKYCVLAIDTIKRNGIPDSSLLVLTIPKADSDNAGLDNEDVLEINERIRYLHSTSFLKSEKLTYPRVIVVSLEDLNDIKSIEDIDEETYKDGIIGGSSDVEAFFAELNKNKEESVN